MRSFMRRRQSLYGGRTQICGADDGRGGLCAAPSDRELFLLKAEILFLLGKWKAAEMVAGNAAVGNLEAGELHYLLGKIESEKAIRKMR